VKICYFGTYRAEYSRNQIMIAGLRRAGVEVIECQQALWNSVDDRVRAASGGWLNPRFIARVCRAYVNLLKRYRAAGAYDVLVVGYPGQFDVVVAWLLSRLRRKPLVWDLLSIYLIALGAGRSAQPLHRERASLIERYVPPSDRLILTRRNMDGSARITSI
jgi:hypothetical protein